MVQHSNGNRHRYNPLKKAAFIAVVGMGVGLTAHPVQAQQVGYDDNSPQVGGLQVPSQPSHIRIGGETDSLGNPVMHVDMGASHIVTGPNGEQQVDMSGQAASAPAKAKPKVDGTCSAERTTDIWGQPDRDMQGRATGEVKVVCKGQTVGTVRPETDVWNRPTGRQVYQSPGPK